MKGYVINPLALLGLMNGYNRPLDRHDFPHGSVPDRAGLFMPGCGEMRRFSNLSMVIDGAAGADMYGFGTKQLHPLGTMAITRDGRIFRYATAGAVLLVEGNLVQGFAKITAHLALTSAAQAIGDGGAGRPIVVTPGATAGAANLYAEGSLVIDTTPGNGYAYRISGHAAITASTVFNLYLDPDDLIQIALSTASRYGLHGNPWMNVVQCPTAITARVAGFAVSPIPANTVAQNYGWIQTRGLVAALINGTPAITSPVANSATTAGAVDVWTTAAAAVTITPVGYMMQVGVSGKNNAVFATVD